MLKTPAYAAASPSSPIAPLEIERREPGANDILIDIAYCGVCHSDIHQARDEWGGSVYPMVPGHEIVGKVAQVGSGVTKWKLGDTVGVGCFVDSCRHCESCREGEEQYCENGMTPTYNGYLRDGKTLSHGGYSTRITVDEKYVVRVPDSLPLDAAAPLLCAGITTYSPLKHFGVKKGDKVGVVGLGGLGHMAVKIAAAMGAHVTVISTTKSKQVDAQKLGAEGFIATKEEGAFEQNANSLNFIIDTVSADHDYNQYLNLLKRDGTMVVVGLPNPQPLSAFSLVPKRRRLAGSMIGGIAETQEMLDFCAKHNIVSEIERIDIGQINDAYERMIRNDVRYRFVIDMQSLKKAA